jgi:hypothetical protein
LTRLAESLPGCGLFLHGVTASPLLGPKGNREFFFHLRGDGEAPGFRIADAIEAALAEGRPS